MANDDDDQPPAEALTCPRTYDRRALRVPGSKLGRCARCRAAVLVSPAGQATIAAHPGMAVLCLACAVVLAGPEPN